MAKSRSKKSSNASLDQTVTSERLIRLDIWLIACIAVFSHSTRYRSNEAKKCCTMEFLFLPYSVIPISDEISQLVGESITVPERNRWATMWWIIHSINLVCWKCNEDFFVPIVTTNFTVWLMHHVLTSVLVSYMGRRHRLVSTSRRVIKFS